MRKDIQERQMELTMKRTDRNRLRRRLNGAESQLKDACSIRDRLHKQLTKEQLDVVKLGRFSFMKKSMNGLENGMKR